jgi:ketosteroid isomerase-like protein
VEFLLDFEEIQVHGDVAHLVSKYWYLSVPKEGGDTLRDAGRSVLIYKKAADGSWLIYLDIDQQTPDVSFPAPLDLLL